MFNPFWTKHNLLYSKTQINRSVIALNLCHKNQLVRIYRTKVAVPSYIYPRHKNLLCWQNVKLPNVSRGGMWSKHKAIKRLKY